MNTDNLNTELLAIGEKIKARGWQGVSIDIYITYLAMFDRPPGPSDPMISYRPSIRGTAHRADGSFYGNGSSQEYIGDCWGVKSFDEAIAKLHETADTMPTMAEEAARIDSAKNRLTESERRLLGVR